MDEKILAIKKGNALPYTDRVYRIVLSTERDKKNKYVPALRCFSLKPTDNGCLSVDWEAKTSPEESIARFGASYKWNKTEYKRYDNREVYALEVSFLNSLQDVEEVIYDPIHFSEPIKGRVNNPAHSFVKFKESFIQNNTSDPETLVKIRNHAVNRKMYIDMDRVHERVEELRSKN